MALLPRQIIARLARIASPHCGQGVGVLLVCLALANSGCLRAITDAPLNAAVDAEEEAGAAPPDENEKLTLEQLEQRLATKVTRTDPTTKAVSTKPGDGWYRQLGAEDEWAHTPGAYRWQHDALAGLLKETNNDRTALRTAMQSKDALVKAAATIGLARLEPQRHDKQLLELAQNTSLPTSARRAAIETLANASALETEAELRNLLDRFGPNAQGVCQEPLVFAEVLAGLARHTAVDQDPLFASALQIEDIDVQLATLSLFAAATAPQLPEDITALAKSPNARVRRAALAAMVKAEHPGVTAHLRDATQDADLHVRIGAIEMLGQVKDREAVLLLYDLLADDQERHREAAAGALVMQQEWPAVERAAKDTSYRVRVAVAAALGKHGDPARAALAKELVRDSSAMVQAKTCESLSTWPPQIAMPILFEGLSSRNMLTRQAALAALTKQGIDAKAFNPGAPPAERATVAKALRERWQKEHPHAGAVFASTSATDGLSREEVARLIKQLQTPGDRSAQWIARKQLERLGQPVLPVLAELQRDKRITLEESTFRDLLPLISPIFVSIEQLRTADIAQRRSAARALAHEAALHPLPPFALERIGSFTRTETDPLVWADILRAASQTTDYVAHDLAMTALTKGESDVRRRACEYLTVCGDERQTEAVAKLLTDRDPVVARAALVALGRCGPPSNRQPVYALLADVDVQQQVLAAQTVARWNDPRGPAALERLALAPSIATRRLAIAAMGELADLQYTDAVLHALDDEPSVQLAALNALPKVAGVDALAEVQPAPVSAAEKARAWQAWDAKRR